MLETAVVVGGGMLARGAAVSAAASAAAFGTGIIARHALDKARVVGASVPELSGPGCMTRERPFLEASLGSSTKVTEFGDFTARDDEGLEDCQWRFRDTLTFTVRLEDVLGPGLRLKLRVRSFMTVGPVELELRASDVGEGGVDLRRRVLSACVLPKGQSSDVSGGKWMSPLLLMPVFLVKGGKFGTGGAPGAAVAHVAVSFSLDTDPDVILAEAQTRARSLSQKFEATEERLRRCLNPYEFDEFDASPEEVNELLRPVDPESAKARAAARAWSVSSVDREILGPDLDPQGWVCRQGANGQTYWHHQALGPAPWDRTANTNARPAPLAPDESPDSWVSRTGEDGRIFWHNRVLGPAPWEKPTQHVGKYESRKDIAGLMLFRTAMKWGRA